MDVYELCNIHSISSSLFIVIYPGTRAVKNSSQQSELMISTLTVCVSESQEGLSRSSQTVLSFSCCLDAKLL